MLNDKLTSFNCTENHYRHWAGLLIYTDGIKHVAETYGAYWLIDAIASYQTVKKVQQEEFQLWILEVKNSSAVLTCQSDTDAPILVKQDIEYTDFPESIKLYVEFGTLLLPSEH